MSQLVHPTELRAVYIPKIAATIEIIAHRKVPLIVGMPPFPVPACHDSVFDRTGRISSALLSSVCYRAQVIVNLEQTLPPTAPTT